MQYFHILKQVQELDAKSYKTLTEKKSYKIQISCWRFEDSTDCSPNC